MICFRNPYVIVDGRMYLRTSNRNFLAAARPPVSNCLVRRPQNVAFNSALCYNQSLNLIIQFAKKALSSGIQGTQDPLLNCEEPVMVGIQVAGFIRRCSILFYDAA